MKISHLTNTTSYTTKDGSLIRELMHPATHGNARQSPAEAIVNPGIETIPPMSSCRDPE